MFNVSVTESDKNPDQRNTLGRVAIIGAGIAGLTVARKLQLLETDCTLFEKSRGPGGRMSSKRIPDSSADIGAQFFTVRNPAFGRFLNQYAGEDSYGLWRGLFRFQGADNVWQNMRPAERYVGTPRMTAITRALSEGLDLKAGVRIASLSREESESGNGWLLTDTKGNSQGFFNTVLVTAPPAQTRELLDASGLERLSGDLSIEISRMQACWTVVVHFPEGAAAGADAFMPNSPVLHWAANNSSKPDRNDKGEWWVLHSDPDWSDEHTETAPEDVIATMLAEFRETCGVTAGHGEIVHHRWLYARPRARTGPGHLWFAEQGIAIAGDWLEGGRVEGAFNSADSLVQRWQSERILGR